MEWNRLDNAEKQRLHTKNLPMGDQIQTLHQHKGAAKNVSPMKRSPVDVVTLRRPISIQYPRAPQLVIWILLQAFIKHVMYLHYMFVCLGQS